LRKIENKYYNLLKTQGAKMSLYTFPSELTAVTVVKRPSASIKSPYVADVIYTDGRAALAHTPGLGCSGLVEARRKIFVSTATSASAKTQCTAQIAECEDAEGIYYVGIHPMVSQSVARSLLPTIYPAARDWRSEVVVEEGTRLDYVGSTGDGKKVYVEVKNAMISLAPCAPRATRRAVFPEGYRKHAGDTISPRAVKHAETLATLCGRIDTAACILLFIVPRDDCGDGLEINSSDPIYHAAIWRAVRAGVQIRAYHLRFSPDGVVSLGRQVPIYI
jgi:sugar fermentation stimulation protein A